MERNTSLALNQLRNSCGTVLPARMIPKRSGGDSQRGFEGRISYGYAPSSYILNMKTITRDVIVRGCLVLAVALFSRFKPSGSRY
jgi:hypothetical protein